MSGPDERDDEQDRSSAGVVDAALPRDQEDRVVQLAETYLERLLSGESPDPSEVILAHPELAAELEWRLGSHRSALSPRRVESFTLKEGVSNSSVVPEWLCGGSGAVRDPARPGARLVFGGLPGSRPKAGPGSRPQGLPHDPTAGHDIRERFQRDARIAARLRHPHIVPVHEANEHEGVCYIDSDLIRGETLEDRLKRGGSPRRSTRSRRAGAEGFRGPGLCPLARDRPPRRQTVQHPDRRHGEPQLTDFGLARSVGEGRTLTVHGQVLGTPAFMSPEQAEGKAPPGGWP